MRVIELGNSAYENGLALGTLQRDVYRMSYELNCQVKTWAQWARNDTDQAYADRIASYTQEEVLDWARRIHQEKMAHLPDTIRFPEMKGRNQYLTDEARGLAVGAGLDERAVFLLRYGAEIRERMRTAPRREARISHCTVFLMNDSADGPVAGFNCDDSLVWAPMHHQRPREVTVLKQTGGRGYSYLCEGPYVNEKGLVVSGVGGGYFEKEAPSGKSFPADVTDLVLRKAANVAEALEILIRYNLYWGPSNLGLMDAEGTMVIVEKSRASYTVRFPSGRTAFATYGGVEDPRLRDLLDQDSPFYGYYTGRMARLAHLAEGLPKEAGADHVAAILADHQGPAPICQHPAARPSGIDLCTVSRGINLIAQQKFRLKRMTRRGEDWHFPCDDCGAEDEYRFN